MRARLLVFTLLVVLLFVVPSVFARAFARNAPRAFSVPVNLPVVGPHPVRSPESPGADRPPEEAKAT